MYGARQLAVLYAPSTTSTALIDAFLEHSALEHYPHYLPRTLLSVSSRKQSQLRVSSFPFLATKAGVSYVALSVAQASQTQPFGPFQAARRRSPLGCKNIFDACDQNVSTCLGWKSLLGAAPVQLPATEFHSACAQRGRFTKSG